MRGSVITRVARLEPLRVAAVVGGVIVLLIALGSWSVLTQDLQAFNVNGEGTVPAIFSAGLWMAAGLAALCAASVTDSRTAAAWSVLGVVLIYLGVDEALVLHERLEKLVGVSYQRLYAPVMLAAAVAGAMLLYEARRNLLVVALLVLGAVCAAGAQLIDVAQWENNQLVLPYWTTVPEELLEMTGLLLVGLSALVRLRAPALRGRVAVPDPRAPRIARVMGTVPGRPDEPGLSVER